MLQKGCQFMATGCVFMIMGIVILFALGLLAVL